MLVQNWKEAWKFFSVRLMVVVGLIAGLEPFMPHLAEFLPEHWVAYAMPIILIARLIKQKNLEVSDE